MDAQSREDIRQHTASLPLVERQDPDAYILDEHEALILWQELRRHESSVPDHIQTQVDLVLEEVLEQVNTTPDSKRHIMTREELRGALVRMAIRSTAQGLYDVGGVLQQTSELNQLLLDDVNEDS